MKKDDSALEDKLLPEYDLKSLRVRKLGSGRKSFATSGSKRTRCSKDVPDY
jgi:hypothetical protein